MSRVFEVDPSDPDSATEALDAAAEAIAAGLLVVIPTETVYGIACRPDDPEATRRLFEAKRRPTGLNLPVLCATEASAWEIALSNDAARRLAKAFWPGPLTMVLNRAEQSMPWELGDHRKTIGVRVPNNSLSLMLLARSGPIAATSANLSGRPGIEDAEGISRAFGSLVGVYLMLGSASRPPGIASTVVDLIGPVIDVRRRGAIDWRYVLRIAKDEPVRS